MNKVGGVTGVDGGVVGKMATDGLILGELTLLLLLLLPDTSTVRRPTTLVGNTRVP